MNHQRESVSVAHGKGPHEGFRVHSAVPAYPDPYEKDIEFAISTNFTMSSVLRKLIGILINYNRSFLLIDQSNILYLINAEKVEQDCKKGHDFVRIGEIWQNLSILAKKRTKNCASVI